VKQLGFSSGGGEGFSKKRRVRVSRTRGVRLPQEHNTQPNPNFYFFNPTRNRNSSTRLHDWLLTRLNPKYEQRSAFLSLGLDEIDVYNKIVSLCSAMKNFLVKFDVFYS
jgi:hypothetical protein